MFSSPGASKDKSVGGMYEGLQGVEDLGGEHGGEDLGD